MMKAKSVQICLLVFLVVFLPAMIFTFASTAKFHNAEAEESSVLVEEPTQTEEPFASNATIEDLTDKNGFFTVRSAPVGRTSVSPICTLQTTMTDSGETITYYCFKWRDISSITFSFSSNLSNSRYVFTNYEFIVTSIQNENLDTPIGQGKTQTLLSNTIANNRPSFPNVYYYFDSDVDTSGSATMFNGTDFGLYKFDFNYTYTENTSDATSHTISIGEIYIAIIPDDIDPISASQISLTYSVSSSNQLMNVYNLSFSNKDTFRYVNPKYIKWTVIGKDKRNVDYVLTKQYRDEFYPSYSYIWSALPNDMQEGDNFILDTNNIEGEWRVYCTIYNSDDTVKAVLSTEILSTIKYEEESNLWLILLIILIIILIAIIISLIIYRHKNKEKV